MPYDTPLSPNEEQRFRSWKQKWAPRDSGEDYDLRGAFKSGTRPDVESGHWPDKFKKPNHPTFSDESMYSTRARPGGKWINGQFHPVGR